MHTRRHILTSAGAAAAVAAVAPKTFAAWEPSERYPDPALKSLDPSFNRYVHFNAGVERLVTGMRWCEGPVYFGDARCLLWSDIPNNRIMRWDEETGRVEGKRLNSPNDITVKSDDTVWFSDPPIGLASNYQGTKATPELPANIYRLDPRTGQATVVAGDLIRPNGVIFSPDEKKLYIQDSGPNPRVIYAYDVVDNGMKVANRRVLITAEPGGTPDGFRCDMDGNLWCGWGMGSAELDGVKVFNSEGKPIGFVSLPERCANVCFGGPKRNRLFMAASHSIYSVYVNTQGVPGS